MRLLSDSSANGRGWSGLKSGEPLRSAEREADVFVTVDQNLQGFKIGVVVLVSRMNRLEDLLLLVPHRLEACPTVGHGDVVVIR
jgi:hypothetical protein